MTEAAALIDCPGCKTVLEASAADGQACDCPVCLWRGRVWRFDPPEPAIDRPAQALPEDAVCAHHPRKKAEAICAGTGDYICSLCAVTVGGATYSAAYLNRPEANDQLAGQLEQNLPRPERRIKFLILLSILPCYQVVLAPAFLAWGVFEYVRLLRLRQHNPLYARVVGPGSAIAAPLLLLIVAAVWLGLVVSVAMGFLYGLGSEL